MVQTHRKRQQICNSSEKNKEPRTWPTPALGGMGYAALVWTKQPRTPRECNQMLTEVTFGICEDGHQLLRVDD